jgi:hypothetical protein
MRKKRLPVFVLAAAATMAFMALSVQHSFAMISVDISGKPLSLMGYLQQSVGWALNNSDYYDTKRNFQQAVFNALIEAQYAPCSDLSFYGSTKINADWAYPLLDSNHEWRDKGFDGSRNRLYILDDLHDILNEAHVTWAPKPFFFRVGKQIVAWGETDGFRLMDQINPQDNRRGFGDVQFENTIIPLWLVRAEYQTPFSSSWLQELTLQTIFNPNVEFRGTERFQPGADKLGINAPEVNFSLGGPYPNDYAHVGSFYEHPRKPDGTFEREGMEVGFRARAVVYDSIITLNYFYGRDNDVVRRIKGLGGMEISPFDGRPIFHFTTDAFYPILRFAGATFTRDIPFLRSSSLGGVAPVLRMEGMYVFSFTTSSAIQTLEKSDEIRWMVGMDWKVRIPLLNPTSYFVISPQFYHRKILDYPHGYKLADYATELEADNYTTTLMITTNYRHNTIQPFFFWMHDVTNRSDMFKAEVAYVPTERWKYTLGVLGIDGSDSSNLVGVGLQPMHHKDQVYFTVRYSF